MSIEIELAGLQSGGANEERAVALLKVTLNNNVYDWVRYVPVETTDLSAFIESIKPSVQAEIEFKEAEWTALTPKTREVQNPLTGGISEVEIDKSEIVKPDVPDYYALRRSEYPLIGFQLDALWKGSGTEDFAALQEKIQEVKQKYPKPIWMF